MAVEDTLFSQWYNLHVSASKADILVPDASDSIEGIESLGEEQKKSLREAIKESTFHSEKQRRDYIIDKTLEIYDKFGSNPVFKRVTEHPLSSTFFEEGERIRRKKWSRFGGLAKYLPAAHDAIYNAEVDALAEISPNTAHMLTGFKRPPLDARFLGRMQECLDERSMRALNYVGMLRTDNPLTGMVEGVAAGLIINDLDIISNVTSSGFVTYESALAGIVSGLVGSLALRNRGIEVFSSRRDFENARVWDTLQYIDMITHFVVNSCEDLGNLSGAEYPVPSYSSLTSKQIDRAYENLKKNPFISSVGVVPTFRTSHSRPQMVKVFVD